MSWNTHRISDIFITWRFRLAVYFINAIRFVGQNMLEWHMGGNFNFIEQKLTFCAHLH
jgi:hypothetical protein